MQPESSFWHLETLWGSPIKYEIIFASIHIELCWTFYLLSWRTFLLWGCLVMILVNFIQCVDCFLFCLINCGFSICRNCWVNHEAVLYSITFSNFLRILHNNTIVSLVQRWSMSWNTFFHFVKHIWLTFLFQGHLINLFLSCILLSHLINLRLLYSTQRIFLITCHDRFVSFDILHFLAFQQFIV